MKILNPTKLNEEKNHVSFSELLTFHKCPYKHYRAYHEGIREPDTIFTVYGTALHNAVEQLWKYNNRMSWISMAKVIILYQMYTEGNDLKSKSPGYKNWVKSAFRIYKDFLPWMEQNFSGWELVDFEFKIDQPLKDFDRTFLGYIDLIIYNPKLDRYMIIDIKTSGWGWNKKQLQDTEKLYQVVLYKKFYCDIKNIDPSKVDCCYLLFLRTPSQKDKYALKLVKQTSGTKRVQNAIDWLDETKCKLKRGIKFKTPQTCDFCICENNKKMRKF